MDAMDDEEWNLSRYWNLKDFDPYMDAKAGKSNKPAPKKDFSAVAQPRSISPMKSAPS